MTSSDSMKISDLTSDLTWPDLTWPDLTWPDLTWLVSFKYERLYSRVEGVPVLVSEPEDEVGPVLALARGVGVAGQLHCQASHAQHSLGLGWNDEAQWVRKTSFIYRIISANSRTSTGSRPFLTSKSHLKFKHTKKISLH